ncbi:MAG: L,D-transpeptidase [Acidimicrobiales bacterium]
MNTPAATAASKAPARTLIALCALATMWVVASCGVTDDYQADEAQSAELEAAAEPDLPTAPAGPDRSVLTPDLVETAVAAGGNSSAKGGLLRGAAAVDPEAVGTIVAHAAGPSVTAYEEPDAESAIIETFANPTARGGPAVFQGIDQSGDWLEVLLPVRPNGTTGWIKADEVTLSINPYRIVVDTDNYQLTIYRYGEEKLTTTIAVGNGATPTPIGDFFLIELLRPPDPGGAYGAFAYGLSGYSDTLDSFNGGNGVIGIHGTNQPQYLGQDVSHGCIRVSNESITEMTALLPLGTPVSIVSDTSETSVERQSPAS